jgi:hypothetical protein
MKFKHLLTAVMLSALFLQCKLTDHAEPNNTYSADVANAWMQMQIRLTRATTGYNSIVSNRSFGYAGITMYESVLPAIPGAVSLLSQIGGQSQIPGKGSGEYYWPASLNAAMADLTRKFFESTSPANLSAIDSLEAVYKSRFGTESTSDKISNAEDFGRQVSTSIFNWSKTDGGDQAYKNVVDPNYIPPVGPGLWIQTPPAFAKPIMPHWGSNRSFLAKSAELTQPGAPIAYSEDPKSPFYAMVSELYTISLSLTHEDSTIVKFWGDQPGNQNVPAHATNILAQLVSKNNLYLYQAAAAYAMHGIAMSDAAISTMQTKYKYNLIRPVSYIRSVMAHPNWNTVIPTPPFGEYSAAHAVVSAASATVLESFFGKTYKFSDLTYDKSYGTRSFDSFDAYAKEAGRSRLLGGLHYSPSIAIGLVQGRQVGEMAVKLKIEY